MSAKAGSRLGPRVTAQLHGRPQHPLRRLLDQAPDEPLQRRGVSRFDLPHLNLRAVGQHHRPVLSPSVLVLLHVVLPGRPCLDCMCYSHIAILYGLTIRYKAGEENCIFWCKGCAERLRRKAPLRSLHRVPALERFG